MKKKRIIDNYKNLDENKRKLLDQLKDNNWLNVKDKIEKESNLCVFLSCPGEKELIADKVCAGETGENLDNILKKLVETYNDISPTIKDNDKVIRYKYNIINSVETVHFRGYNGAEAKEKDIRDDNNIKRVLDELRTIKEIKYIIICGNNAEILFNNIKDYEEVKKKIENAKIAIISHLGWVALRNKYKNTDEKLKDCETCETRDNKRIELIVKEITDEFNK